MDSAATRANDSARVLIMRWIRKYWKEQNDHGRFITIVVAMIYVCIICFMVKHNKDYSELKKNHLYCYGVVVEINRTEIYHYHISYTIGEKTFSRSWQRGKGAAHLGDTVLVMYNPKKPSVHVPVEYDGRFVTKRMVDFRAYPIDQTLIQYGPNGQIILKPYAHND